MEITKTLYVTSRDEWRQWLGEHYATEPEIWLIYYNKASGKPRIPYNDAVEEALCFGWIDSTAKKLNDEATAQKFSPRKPKSFWSELNKERARRLIAQGKMTEAGSVKLPDLTLQPLNIAPDIVEALQAQPPAWEHFTQFDDVYKRIRLGFVEDVRKRDPAMFQQRLAYFVKMTAQNKTFGTKL